MCAQTKNTYNISARKNTVSFLITIGVLVPLISGTANNQDLAAQYCAGLIPPYMQRACQEHLSHQVHSGGATGTVTDGQTDGATQVDTGADTSQGSNGSKYTIIKVLFQDFAWRVCQKI